MEPTVQEHDPSDRHHWTRLRRQDGVLPAAFPARALMAIVSSPASVASTGLAAMLGASWLFIHLVGGAGIAVPHGYYVPVLFAAVRFGRSGALVTALVAGVLAGPLTYQQVATGLAQTPSEWVTRTVAFVLVGQLVAWLFTHALASVREDACLARADRELADAIDAGQLSLRYQPVHDVASWRMVGVEALVRWDHPDGERGPFAFLPTAERSGRIHEVGDLVLRTACEQGARWQREARERGTRAPVVSVNLSSQELAAEDLVIRVRGVVEETGLDPHKLCLEVTEGALAHDIEGSAARLSLLRQLGVRVAIDDFGTGYSSLAYVHRFPADLLKIDRSFVREMEHSQRARTLVHGIVLLCGELGVTAVAEGIENDEQLRIATDMRCPLVQGFLLGRPETAAQIDARLAEPEAATADGGPAGPALSGLQRRVGGEDVRRR
ncbi:EAL domain-containing protein [Nitriliruptor alkaliphilus]|uniref:EAL domain-containing protein n=1 Tax=Nitriliruptor alkaliphilus TaxID=427918 RepID=UPI001B807484|nr:EAL domain-containing protein [Nitriliruptor alkaliphilus]